MIDYVGVIYNNYIFLGNKNVNIDITVAPCSDKKKKVIQCYQEHPREILKCANVVEEFSSCVDQCRANIIAARC